jgi:hypothetical protein
MERATRSRSSSTTCCALMIGRNGSDLSLTADFPSKIKALLQDQ